MKLLNTLYTTKYFKAHVDKEGTGLCNLFDNVLNSQDRTLSIWIMWGVHEKQLANKFDKQGVFYFSEIIKYIERHFEIKTSVSVVLSDSHAELNVISQKTVNLYCAGMKQLFNQVGWNIIMLSSLWEQYGIKEKIKENDFHSTNIKEYDLYHNFSKLYYRGDDFVVGTNQYIQARILEKDMLEKEFPNFLYLTSGDNRMTSIEPDIPTMWVYSIKKNFSKKPWFLKE